MHNHLGAEKANNLQLYNAVGQLSIRHLLYAFDLIYLNRAYTHRSIQSVDLISKAEDWFLFLVLLRLMGLVDQFKFILLYYLSIDRVHGTKVQPFMNFISLKIKCQ